MVPFKTEVDIGMVTNSGQINRPPLNWSGGPLSFKKTITDPLDWSAHQFALENHQNPIPMEWHIFLLENN